MKDESALKTFSWETDEITKWVSRKIICAISLPSDPKETVCLKTKKMKLILWGRELNFGKHCGVTITEQLHMKVSSL